jgi:hypothetical protein
VNDSRPALNLGSVLLAIAVIAGLGIYLPLRLSYKSVGESPSREEPVQPAETRPPRLIVEPDVSVTANAFPEEPPVLEPESSSPPVSVPTEPVPAPVSVARPAPTNESAADDKTDQTSWDEPFDAKFWESSGWKFDSESMSSYGETSTATFRRAYVRLMFECHIEPQAESAEPLRVRLTGRQPNAVMTLTIDGDRLVITDDSRTLPTVIKEGTVSAAATAGQPSHLKLAATGNRLIVSWNGTVALTCNQIASQSGRAVRFEFATVRTPWRIRDLRIEGE